MEALITPSIDWAAAALAQPGQRESGDRHLVLSPPDGGLVAVVDGLGHSAAMSIARFSFAAAMLMWLGVGNVEGRLLHAPLGGAPPPLRYREAA